MRDMRNTFVSLYISQPGMTAIYSGVTKTENKLGISRFFRAIHNRYRVSSVYDTYTVPILSLSPQWASVCTRKRQRARETMRLGLQCLANRLSESYRFQRIASSNIQRPKRHNETAKNVRALRAKQWTYKDRLGAQPERKECSIRSFAPRPEYINFAMSRFCIHQACTLCALWKYRRWAIQRGLFSQTSRRVTSNVGTRALRSIEMSTEEQIVRYAAPIHESTFNVSHY